MKLKSMLMVAAMALVGGAANAQSCSRENEEPTLWVNVRENLFKDNHYVYADDVLEECKAMVKERNASLKGSPEMLSKNRFLTGVEIYGCPECMVHTIKLNTNINIDKLPYEQFLKMYSKERMNLIKIIKADSKGGYGTCLRRWIDAGYKVFYIYTDKNGDAFPLALQIQTEDIVEDLQENVQLVTKVSGPMLSVCAELQCSDAVFARAKELIDKMNAEFERQKKDLDFKLGLGVKDDFHVYTRLDYASKSLVFLNKIIYADTLSLQEKRAKLNFDGVEKEFVNMVSGLHVDGKAVLTDLIKAGYSVKMQFCDNGGALLYETTVTSAPQHGAAMAVSDGSIVGIIGAVRSYFGVFKKITAAVLDKEDDAVADDNGVIFEVVERNASFPGGNKALMDYLYKNLKYPTDALSKNKEGRVVVKFVINKDGSICDVEVVGSVDPELDAEAVRVVKAMPRWTPGRIRGGRAVRVRYLLPITFSLGGTETVKGSVAK